MKKAFECDRCLFFHERGFQDMGCSMDVCRLNPDIWDALISGSDAPTWHCPLFRDLAFLIRECRKDWRNDYGK